MTETFRWGILGTGRIAGVFADGLTQLPDATLLAVGSRAQETADAFGEKYAIPRRYASYAELAADPDVDAIYVASPHSGHRPDTLLCLEHGKAVICEKPFAINAAQAREMVDFARAHKIFLMEAMWTRFLPLMVKVRELIAEGAIGDVLMLQSDFGFRTDVNPKSRLFDMNLGGGGLLDVGVYPVSLASMIFGKPERIASLANLGATGVDEQGAAIFSYAGGKRMAIVSTAVRTNTPHETVIMGSAGSMKIHAPSWAPRQLTLRRGGQSDELVEIGFPGNGYQYEAAELMRCVREGRLESAVIPLDETIQVMETMDAIRAQWGLKYPME